MGTVLTEALNEEVEEVEVMEAEEIDILIESVRSYDDLSGWGVEGVRKKDH